MLSFSSSFQRPASRGENSPLVPPFYMPPSLWEVFDSALTHVKGGKSVWIRCPQGHGRTTLLKRLQGCLEEEMIVLFLDCAALPTPEAWIEHITPALHKSLCAQGLMTDVGENYVEQLGLCLATAMEEGLRIVLLMDNTEHLSCEVTVFLQDLLEFRSVINGQVVYETPILSFVGIGGGESASWKQALEESEQSLVCLNLPFLNCTEVGAYMRLRLSPYAGHPTLDPFTQDVQEEVYLLTHGRFRPLCILMNYAALFLGTQAGQLLCPRLLERVVVEALKVNPDLLMPPLPWEMESPVSFEEPSLMSKLLAFFRPA